MVLDSTFDLQQDNTPTQTRLNAHRVAWVVLVMSFIGFCLICASTSFGVYYFFFQSTVPIDLSVRVARGSVGVIRTDLTEKFEFEGLAISRGDTVLTDSQSQSVLSLYDNRNPETLVAAITLKSDTRMVVEDALQPRFDWSGNNYLVILEGALGEADIFVPENLERDAVISVRLPFGTIVDIRSAGLYTVIISESRIRLETRYGQAAILPPDRSKSLPVVTDQIGIYDVDTGAITVGNGYDRLVVNDIFRTSPVDSSSISQQGANLPVLENWNCGDRTTDAIRGDFTWEIFEGRPAVRLWRGGGTQTHGETTCVQPFGQSGQVGRRVDMYDYLSIRTTVYIDSHSLDACGVQGSECPIMLLMDYVDVDGNSNQWFHGFYAQNSGSDYPLTCVSCQLEHKRVNDKAWYTFESGNLFTLLPPDRRPATILNVRFYASGHEYDVYISEMSLLAAPHYNQDVTEPVIAPPDTENS